MNPPKRGLPPALRAIHIQSKKDTESIKRWLQKHASPTIRAGRKTARSTLLRRASDVKRKRILMTPYIARKFHAAIAARQRVLDYHRLGRARAPAAASHDAFVWTLRACYRILATACELPGGVATPGRDRP